MKHSGGKDRDIERFMIYFDLIYLLKDEGFKKCQIFLSSTLGP